MMSAFLDTKIDYLKGVGPKRALLLQSELGIYTYNDLLHFYPFRYEDRTKIHKINEMNASMPYIQLKGVVKHINTHGQKYKKRLVVSFQDESGSIELVWFKGLSWISKHLVVGHQYLVFGKPNSYGNKINIVHPEIELVNLQNTESSFLQPVYSSTEKLKKHFLDSKGISKLVKTLLLQGLTHVFDSIPSVISKEYNLIPKQDALAHIHFPENQTLLHKAKYRLKFEELFFIQLQLFKIKFDRFKKFKGQVLSETKLLNNFYYKHLPFSLTNAQKRVIKEIFKDLKSGLQMNRLLQGDVGSGKTIVSFICILIAVGSNTQAALMAPTEILAEQHYKALQPFAEAMNINMAILTGSTKKKARDIILEKLKSKEIDLLIGTHALLEDRVQFKNLGLCVIDEQHRFGVAQRAKLWKKNQKIVPHILVMTATPIPRTLAMTLYGDLEISVIDELPAGRKPIQTIHQYDANRLKLNGFIKKQVDEGRQVYIVYPLIEESDKLELKDLMDGYESICRAFPEYAISIVHGKMKSEDKAFEMKRFVKGETNIMVATTVIEVGVNVPNATIMVIENAERFGLAQLHQLRGRVGRGGNQSYCILMTKHELSSDARTRIHTMVKTTDGFEIANVDLKLRGPGSLAGTAQSGVLDLKIADLTKDSEILSLARHAAKKIIESDPSLEKTDHTLLKAHLEKKKLNMNWSRIS